MSDRPLTRYEYLSQFVGQPVAVMAARYQYRGKVAEVGDSYLVLADAVVIEVSGPGASKRAQTEDPLHCSVMISFDAIEIVYQPAFAMVDL